MRRKLPPLTSCPELRLINKTMIIEVPEEFRKPGEPFFQIVSSLDDDPVSPGVKFKANYILKSILENGTEGKKLDSICIEEDSSQSAQLSHEKACEKLSNVKVSDQQSSFKTKLAHSNTSGKSTSSIWTSTPSAMDNDLNHTVDRFNLASKTSSAESDSSSSGLRVHKEKQRTSPSVSTTEPISASKNFERANSRGTVQQISKPVQGQANNSKSFQTLEDEDLSPFQKFRSQDWQPFRRTGKAMNQSPQKINTYNSGSVEKLVDNEGFEMEDSDNSFHKEADKYMPPQGRSYQHCRSHQEIEYHNSVSPQQTNHDSVPPQKTNHKSGMFRKKDGNFGLFQQFPNHNSALSGQKSDMHSGHFQQHNDFEDFHQHAGQNYRIMDSDDEKLKSSTELHDYGGSKKIQQVPYYDHSDINLKNAPANQCSSYSDYGAPYRDTSKMSHSSSWKSGQNAGYIYNQNDRFNHTEGQTSRTLVEIPRVDDSRSHFSQISRENTIKLSIDELPKHCFWRRLDYSEMKQILFVDAMSNRNFFLEFVRTPPAGTHIWAFMPKGYFVKLPETLDKIELVNMKLLHVVSGSVSARLSDMLYELHQTLPLNVPFTVYSNMEFRVVNSIIEANRTVNIVVPRVNGNISHVYQALHR